MRKNILLVLFITILSIFIYSSTYAAPGINGGDECSGPTGLGYKDSFCCTIDHSGSRGNCEDVVVNNLEKKCAFVENIDQCQKLPINWQRAEENETWGRVCPSQNYQWIEELLNCAVQTNEKVIDENIENNLDNNITKDDQQILDQNQNTNLEPIIIVVGLLILIVAGWFFFKKK